MKKQQDEVEQIIQNTRSIHFHMKQNHRLFVLFFICLLLNKKNHGMNSF